MKCKNCYTNSTVYYSLQYDKNKEQYVLYKVCDYCNYYHREATKKETEKWLIKLKDKLKGA